MKIIERIPWDSTFFGFEIGKVTLAHGESLPLEAFKREVGAYALVYIFSQEEIQLENFNLVDKKVVFSQKTPISTQNVQNTITLCPFDKSVHDLDALIALALESGSYSRFKTDPNFTESAYKKLYTQWIMNAVDGKLAFTVLIALKEDEMLGFITLGKKTENLVDIGLVAVSKRARGQGVASALITKAFEVANEKNFDSIQVVTQQDNKPATGLYTKMGFALEQTTMIYHYWNL